MNIFSKLNKLSEFGAKCIKMSPETNSVSGLLLSVRSMAEARGQSPGNSRSLRRRSLEHLLDQCGSINPGKRPYLETSILETGCPSSVLNFILAFTDSS